MKQEKEPGYLTDEQLLQLIEATEAGGLLSAPDYLKNKILKKAVKNSKTKQHEFVIFCTKITAAAAASVALLFAMPDFGMDGYLSQPDPPVRREITDDIREDSLFRKINQKANSFCGIIADGANVLFEKEDYKNDQ